MSISSHLRAIKWLLSSHFSQLGHADDWFHQAIKVDNPNQLAYWVFVDEECLTTKEGVEEIVEGVFIRSRIKPMKNAIYGNGIIYLDVYIACLKREEDWFVYEISVYFARRVPVPSILFDRSYGSLGIGGDTNIAAAIKERVEIAITEYIKANFDL